MAANPSPSALARMWNSGRFSNAALHAARRESFAKRFVLDADGIAMIHRRRRYRITAAEQREAQAGLEAILAASGRRLNLCIIAGIATFILFAPFQRQISGLVPDDYRWLAGTIIGALPFVGALAIGVAQEVAVHRLFGRIAATAIARAGGEPRVSEADLTLDSLPVGLVATVLFVAGIGTLAWWLG